MGVTRTGQGMDEEAMTTAASLVRVVETEYYSFARDNPFETEGGKQLSPVTLAYETYGALNGDRSNAILVLHALTGDAHAAGWHEGDKEPGLVGQHDRPGQGLRH